MHRHTESEWRREFGKVARITRQTIRENQDNGFVFNSNRVSVGRRNFSNFNSQIRSLKAVYRNTPRVYGLAVRTADVCCHSGVTSYFCETNARNGRLWKKAQSSIISFFFFIQDDLRLINKIVIIFRSQFLFTFDKRNKRKEDSAIICGSGKSSLFNNFSYVHI